MTDKKRVESGILIYPPPKLESFKYSDDYFHKDDFWPMVRPLWIFAVVGWVLFFALAIAWEF